MARATVSLAGKETPVMMTSTNVTDILVDNTPTAPTLQAALAVHVLLVTQTTQAVAVQVVIVQGIQIDILFTAC